MKVDKETSETLQRGERHLRLVDSEDWSELKDFLERKMVALYKDVDTNTPNEVLGENVKANHKAVSIIQDLIAELEGSAYQFDLNKDMLFDNTDLYDRL